MTAFWCGSGARALIRALVRDVSMQTIILSTEMHQTVILYIMRYP